MNDRWCCDYFRLLITPYSSLVQSALGYVSGGGYNNLGSDSIIVSPSQDEYGLIDPWETGLLT